VIVYDDSLHMDDDIVRNKPEVAVGPDRPVITPVAIPVSRARLVLPCRGNLATIFTTTATSNESVDYDYGDLATESLTFSGIGHGVCDPHLGFFTVHYIRSQPGAHHHVPMNLPISAFAMQLGGSFAVEPILEVSVTANRVKDLDETMTNNQSINQSIKKIFNVA